MSTMRCLRQRVERASGSESNYYGSSEAVDGDPATSFWKHLDSILKKVGRTMQTSFPKKHIPLIVRVFLGLLLAPIVVVGGLFLIVVAWMRTMHSPWFRERWVRFNKQTLNPTTLKIAGRRSSVYATLKHVGRRSGRAFTTPVVAKPLGDGFVIPLPYDAGVDWCRNVLAAGTCTLIWNEQEYMLERPELIQPSEALKAFPAGSRLLYPAGGIKQYLWLHQHKEVPETVPMNAEPTPLGMAGHQGN